MPFPDTESKTSMHCLCAYDRKADCERTSSEPCEVVFSFSLSPHWHVPGFAQSGNLTEGSFLLGFRRALQSQSRLALPRCRLPAFQQYWVWGWVCAALSLPPHVGGDAFLFLWSAVLLCLILSSFSPLPLSLLPVLPPVCSLLWLGCSLWLLVIFLQILQWEEHLLLLDCSGEGLLCVITTSSCMFCVLCSNIAVGAPVCAPCEGSPKPQRNCCVRRRWHSREGCTELKVGFLYLSAKGVKSWSGGASEIETCDVSAKLQSFGSWYGTFLMAWSIPTTLSEILEIKQCKMAEGVESGC